MREADSGTAFRTSEPRYLYRAYGLSITSAFPLPELTEGGAGGEVTIRVGAIAHAPTGSTAGGIGFEVNGAGIYFRYAEVGTYRVSQGREILVDPLPGADERLVRLFLTGPVLAALLHQRGLLVLHASVIRAGDHAVGFLGGPRAGKSTTAAALGARGYRLVSDDLLPIDVTADSPAVHPGYPQLKLWPEAIVQLGGDPAVLPRLRADLEKRSQRVTSGFERETLPLGRLYVLEEGEALSIEDVRGNKSVIELVRHSYFAPELATLGSRRENFLQCSQIASTAPLHRIRRPAEGARLGDVVALVERHLADRAGQRKRVVRTR